ncbi:MAG: hypothetical protein WDZ27_06290 [Waddliaceae bacterium]
MSAREKKEKTEGFGTIKGVLIPNITMMFGVILFLRLGVITGSSGILQMLLAIGLSFVIMTLTSLSIGSLTTNMKVGSGGVYYIISRVLGLEVGGAIGLGIYFAQIISMAMTISGFAISICELFPSLELHSVEIATLFILALLSGYSASWALRLQGVILAILLISIVSIFFGSVEGLPVIEGPVMPFYSGTMTFWTTFSLFYPAMTGIEAGMAMSGSLRNPARSLFYGNLLSLVFVAFSYSAVALFAFIKIPHSSLVSDPFALLNFAASSPLVLVGIWGATLSSALGCLLGAPRMLQSMAADGVITQKLANVGNNPDEGLFRPLVVTTILTAIVMLFTTMDQIIPMLTMICLVSYGLLNFVTAFSQLMSIPSWRPRLQFPWWASMTAVLIIIISMLMIAPGWSFITFFILLAVYFGIRAQDVESGFQDLRESFVFFLSRLTVYHLGKPTEHALTWHLQLLALIGAPTTSQNLVRISDKLTKRSGILTFAAVVPEEWQTLDRMQLTRQSFTNHFQKLGIVCLSQVYPANSMNEGYIQLIKAFGIGPIQPNTVAMEISEESIDSNLIELIETCRLTQKNLILMRDSKKVPESWFLKPRFDREKRIDIWWDPNDTRNFDLSMSLLTTLRDGVVFNGARVTVKTKVDDINTKKEVKSYLKDFLRRSRIEGDVVVYVSNQKIDKSASLRFMPLAQLEAPEDLEEDDRESRFLNYTTYLQEQLRNIQKDEVVLFVTSYDTIDHRAIYIPKINNEL